MCICHLKHIQKIDEHCITLGLKIIGPTLFKMILLLAQACCLDECEEIGARTKELEIAFQTGRKTTHPKRGYPKSVEDNETT